MNRWTKLAIVLAGYALALLASLVAVGIYDRRFSPADNQAMGGMIAGGEMIYGIGVFLLGALVPTGLALWFVRRHRPTWSVFTVACIAFAVAGLVTVLGLMVVRDVPVSAPLLVLGMFGASHMLGSPLCIVGFGLLALLAPARDLRLRMLVAAGIELVIAACGLVHFLVPRPPI